MFFNRKKNEKLFLTENENQFLFKVFNIVLKSKSDKEMHQFLIKTLSKNKLPSCFSLYEKIYINLLIKISFFSLNFSIYYIKQILQKKTHYILQDIYCLEFDNYRFLEIKKKWQYGNNYSKKYISLDFQNIINESIQNDKNCILNKTNIEEKINILKFFIIKLKEKKDDLIGIIAYTLGKKFLSTEKEIDQIIHYIEYYINQYRLLQQKSINIEIYPKGLCLMYIDFYKGILNPIISIVISFIMGNSIILSSDEDMTILCQFIYELLFESGVSKNLIYFDLAKNHLEKKYIDYTQFFDNKSQNKKIKNTLILTKYCDQNDIAKKIKYMSFFSSDKRNANILIMHNDLFHNVSLINDILFNIKSIQIGSQWKSETDISFLNNLKTHQYHTSFDKEWILEPHHILDSSWTPGIRMIQQIGALSDYDDIDIPFLTIVNYDKIDEIPFIISTIKNLFTCRIETVNEEEFLFLKQNINCPNICFNVDSLYFDKMRLIDNINLNTCNKIGSENYLLEFCTFDNKIPANIEESKFNNKELSLLKKTENEDFIKIGKEYLRSIKFFDQEIFSDGEYKINRYFKKKQNLLIRVTDSVLILDIICTLYVARLSLKNNITISVADGIMAEHIYELRNDPLYSWLFNNVFLIIEDHIFFKRTAKKYKIIRFLFNNQDISDLDATIIKDHVSFSGYIEISKYLNEQLVVYKFF